MISIFAFDRIGSATLRMQWLAVFALIFSLTSQVALSAVDPSMKASSEVQARMALGKPQNIIVVFDDQSIQNEAKNLQSATGVRSSHKSILEYKARRLTETKLKVLSTVTSGEATELKHYSHLPVSFVRIQSRNALDKLLADPGVMAVYENSVLHRAMLAQSLPLIGQPQAAAAGDQGSGTTVAVLDQRVDYTQPAFGSCTSPGVPSGCKVVLAQDVIGLPNDGLGYQDGHGTNVAATVLAVAPGSKIISLNVFNGESATDTDVIDAINWCIANASNYNIVAMNLSLGGGGNNIAVTTSSPYYSAFANARAAGILPVVAAGNNGYSNGLSLPAAVVGAVSVGAVYDSEMGQMGVWSLAQCTDPITVADQVTCFSNNASFLTLLAPGCRDDAGTASPNYMCGTSQAAPHVAGAVAVLRSAFPSETLDQTVTRLTNGVPVTDSKNGVTKPRLSLPMALGLSSCSYIVSPTNISPSASGTTSSNISITNGTGCAWSAISNANWITILSGSSGIGSGTAQYSIDANYGTSARTGTISIAGQTITVTQPGGYVSLSSLTNVWLVGSYSYQTSGLNTVTLSVGEIYHNATGTTGTLRLELWLTQFPFSFSSSPAWGVAKYQISIPASPNGVLGAYQSFINITTTLPLVNLPAAGSYYASLLITQYDSNTTTCSSADHFCTVSYGGFTGQFFIPDVTAPTVPTGLAATTISATQVNLAWNASSDNVAVTAYKIYNKGTLIGRVTTAGASGSSLTPATQYQFTVSACDAAENCSAQTASVSTTTPVSRSSCIFNWVEQNYPQYFPSAGGTAQTTSPYTGRYYSGTGSYLATSSADNNLYVLSPNFGNTLVNTGLLSSFLSASGCP